ncbi:MAG: hypothetical protein C0501_09115 [Isosphaera sp.]|nr:hypothetical protein [Isosphaera sp.]
MTPHALRPAALAAGLALALAGCGDKPKPDDKGGKKDDPRPLVTDPKADPGTPPKVDPKVDVTTGVGKEAVDFLQAVAGETAGADRLSAGFARAVGQPAVSAADKEKGYSPAAAAGWLRGVGRGVGFGPPLTATRVGDVALFRGALVGKSGGYALRMVGEGGAWKADWLSLSSVVPTGPDPGTAPDAVLQQFAASAVAAAVCDKDVMGRDERVAAVAAGLTPALRAQLAPPLEGDKALGYSPPKLGWKLDEIGGKAEAAAVTPARDAAFRVEVARAGGAKAAYLMKLVKGAAPGQWIVDGITPQ